MRSKDAHYDQVVTMKDSKLMNLIEGTDFQSTAPPMHILSQCYMTMSDVLARCSY